MEIRQITPAIGAEITGIHLGDAARDPALFADIKAALLRHRVLFFRKQDITRAEHVAFASAFGKLEDHPVVGSDPDHPGLVRVYRSDNPHSYENNYHCDGLWRPNPAMGAVLRCIECPDIGGDTIWVNMVKAYEELPDDIKAKVDGLRARASIEQSFGAVMTPEARAKLAQDHPPVEHPVVRTHPETGEKVLFVGAGFSTYFTNYSTPANVRHGIDKAPGAALLLNYLISRATIPEYQVRWSWQRGDVAVWDNRCTQHYALNDYFPAPRKMERAAIVGDIPY
ncbi:MULTISPECIES: TauD/TfdA dioxygenase family protein [Cupriavidus]|uniref:Taurine dioxygenase n=1 Tax=Cupriavidus oxalaticus TaxID=96344 RepID=A0A4P7L612_9BURK|nr:MULTISPECIES: TauD/TfdA family dioxygenase [Cupriavidus]MBF6988312.1 TauD/TfdA family dioxygenase [Cupriavidus sp. IK-TO18]QBY50984.1 taurine dioxygenase [Cupriavidus oxalaticus]TDF66747.1 taurine dioxygenase [Cupriavidus sp. L7L]